VTKLRELARNQDCQVRIPGICNGDPATTVLAHYSLSGISGGGLKSPDIMGAWCCSTCHDYADGRKQSANFNREQVRLMFAEGVFRTQNALYKMGVIR
jgi:hypothetical protein